MVTVGGCGAAATTMLNAFVPVLFAASVTCTVNDAVPAAVGVPEITPVDATRLNPAGNVPALTLQLYGVVPPLACSVVEYAVPAVPPGSDVVVTVGGCGAAATTMLKAFVPVLFAASFTCTVNETVPGCRRRPRDHARRCHQVQSRWQCSRAHTPTVRRRSATRLQRG